MIKPENNITPQPDVLDGIKGNYNLVIEIMANEIDSAFSNDEKSVKMLDNYITENRKDFVGEMGEKMVSVLGSYLGEAIIKEYGGKWVLNEEYLCIHLKEDSFAFPFSKIRKHIFDGPEDSIHSFFTTIPYIMDGNIRIKNEKM